VSYFRCLVLYSFIYPIVKVYLDSRAGLFHLVRVVLRKEQFPTAPTHRVAQAMRQLGACSHLNCAREDSEQCSHCYVVVYADSSDRDTRHSWNPSWNCFLWGTTLLYRNQLNDWDISGEINIPQSLRWDMSRHPAGNPMSLWPYRHLLEISVTSPFLQCSNSNDVLVTGSTPEEDVAFAAEEKSTNNLHLALTYYSPTSQNNHLPVLPVAGSQLISSSPVSPVQSLVLSHRSSDGKHVPS
jgi:hypothetical protein